jgi:hypothetical protein
LFPYAGPVRGTASGRLQSSGKRDRWIPSEHQFRSVQILAPLRKRGITMELSAKHIVLLEQLAEKQRVTYGGVPILREQRRPKLRYQPIPPLQI